MELKCSMGPGETVYLGKSSFVAHWRDGRKATYLGLDCMKIMHTNWNRNVPFIIPMDFDHVWAEHYPITLNIGQNSLF